MKVAVTGATGFLGRYIVRHLIERGHTCKCWYRPESDRGGFDGVEDRLQWVAGDLGDESSMRSLVTDQDAIVHAALYRPGAGFRGAEGDLPKFVERNVLATIRLIEAARSAGTGRFVFISTCAVHEVILDDRKLDEAHPSWATSHYGAHKAAIEMFVHSFGLGEGYEICSLRPTGIYGLARPIENSKWYALVQDVKRGNRYVARAAARRCTRRTSPRLLGFCLRPRGSPGRRTTATTCIYRTRRSPALPRR